MPENDDNKKPPVVAEGFRRAEDYRSRYANNVYFNTSIWDLKTTFGELTFEDSKAYVEQHTSVTMSWLQAKIAAIFLVLNVAIHEEANGTINIPAVVKPPILTDDEAKLPVTQLIESILKRYPPAPTTKENHEG